jgi:hypothetical protein
MGVQEQKGLVPYLQKEKGKCETQNTFFGNRAVGIQTVAIVLRSEGVGQQCQAHCNFSA